MSTKNKYSINSPIKTIAMSEFKVIYLALDSSIKSTYVIANSKDEARDLVFNRVLDCSQTLSAEYTS